MDYSELTRQAAEAVDHLLASAEYRKGDIFITDLSFILWFLLDALTLGVLGVFFVNPYVFGTRAEIYAQLRQTALENGLATTVELPGFGDTGPRRMSGESWYN